jgi:hypothetical protein
VSEDVASLDSWSELNDVDDVSSPVRRTSRVDTPVEIKAQKNSSNQLLLNPAKLFPTSVSRNFAQSKNYEHGKTPKSQQAGASGSGRNVGVNFDLPTSSTFDSDDDSFDNINSVYLSLPEDSTCLKESYSVASTSENSRDFEDRSDFRSLPDLTAVTSKARTYPPHYVHPKSVQYPEHGEASDKVKNKLMSMWNNVKYGLY